MNQWIALSVTVILAGAGYLAKYLNDLVLARRRDRLDRLNRQLSELYGPLLAVATAGRSCWRAFRARYRPGGGAFWGSDPPPTAEEAAAYRLWMTEVFMPLNERMAEIVITKADLLDGVEMPRCLTQLCAHVAGHRSIAKRWDAGDLSEHSFGLNFPQEVYQYLEDTFSHLKAEQTRLLNREREGGGRTR
jgi:hypothetical protein